MYKIIIILTLILSINGYSQVNVSSKSINKITSDDFNGTHNQVILDGKLFFVDNDGYIWISEGTSETTKALLYNNQKVKSHKQNALVKLDDSIVFVNLSDGFTLWKTDGINFEKISDSAFNFYSGIYKVADSVVGLTEINQNIAIYDGQNVFNADISSLTEPRANTVCPLNNGDFTILARDNDLNYSKLYSYSNGVISQIANDVINNTNVSGLPMFALEHDNACYYHYLQNNEEGASGPKYLQVSQEFNVATITSSEGIDTWKEIFVFDESLYIVRNEIIIDEANEFDGNQIFQVNSNSSAPIKLEDVNIPGPISNINASSNYLYFTRGYYFPPGSPIPSPPPPPILNVLDRSFNQILGDLYASYDYRSKVSSRGNEDILFTNRINYSIDFIENDVMTPQGLYSAAASISDIFSDDLMTYAIGTDRSNDHKQAIYKISDQALISDQLTGLWINPKWQSQGLSLHTGKRPDGSVYLFVSLYIYRNGEPLWLAGSTDFALGDYETSFELFEFKGSSFLPNEINVPIERIPFGQITLHPAGCNDLNMLLNINDSEDVSLNLTRIVNINNAGLCIPK